MNKIYITGSVHGLKNETGKAGKCVTTFLIKTKKLVGYGKKGTISYDHILCDIRGNKADFVFQNFKEGDKAAIWGRLDLDNQNHLTVAVDEIDRL